MFVLLSAVWWKPSDLRAQAAANDSSHVFQNAVHVDFSGVSSIASINYERVLLKKDKLNMLARIGLGSIHLNDFTRRFNPDLLVPIGLYWTYGRRVMAEVGAGGTFTSIAYPDERTFKPSRRSKVHGWCSVGIRGRITDRIWLRAAFTPIFEFGRVTRAFELGVGYRF